MFARPHPYSLLFFTLTSLVSLTLHAATPSAPKERKLYVGKDSTEAKLSFSHEVEFSSNKKPSEEDARTQIKEQLNHLFGPMAAASQRAVPRGNHLITRIGISPKTDENNTYVAKYSYEGTIVLQNGAADTYEILLPINPGKIYSAAMVGNHNPCTDEHYQSEGDFWYFWNPNQAGCKLKLGQHYDRVEARIERVPNTATYPEYDRLAEKDSEGNNLIHMSLLFGMDDPAKSHKPLTSDDTNADNFKKVRSSLIKMGYESKPWTNDLIRAVTGDVRPLPYVEDLTKDVGKIRLQVRMFFGPSGINEKSKAFHFFFKSGIEDSAVMVYDGHSGLGGHLDLESIEENEGFKFQPKKDRYQIYFFNSCSSYSYYNTMFFDRKKTAQDPAGTKNLDILTNGLATYFYVMHDTNLALIRAIDAWASGKGVINYPRLAEQIDSGNLFGVNGDEDNPTNPPAMPRQ